MFLGAHLTPITPGIGSVEVAERFRNYLDREEPQLSTIDDRTGVDRLLDRLRAEYREPRVDTAPQLLKARRKTRHDRIVRSAA
jgi:hypothetical protein